MRLPIAAVALGLLAVVSQVPRERPWLPLIYAGIALLVLGGCVIADRGAEDV